MRSDEQLMEQYRENGDQRAFRVIYARQAPLLRRFIQKRVFRVSDVEDLLQQTFQRLHEVRASYRTGELLRPWLCTIAGNLVRDYLRRLQRRPELSLELTHVSLLPVAEPFEIEQPNQALEAALEHLSEVTQRIMQEHFAQDRPLVEIARDLGEQPSTVRVRLHRGCRKLRSELMLSGA